KKENFLYLGYSTWVKTSNYYSYTYILGGLTIKNTRGLNLFTEKDSTNYNGITLKALDNSFSIHPYNANNDSSTLNDITIDHGLKFKNSSDSKAIEIIKPGNATTTDTISIPYGTNLTNIKSTGDGTLTLDKSTDNNSIITLDHDTENVIFKDGKGLNNGETITIPKGLSFKVNMSNTTPVSLSIFFGNYNNQAHSGAYGNEILLHFGKEYTV
ncbi:MAG: hypothetical protein LBF97_08415, partial [Elusimicrobiota bacterium]|nr:hypothetical protein [Elusimicrobiota bacterium]